MDIASVIGVVVALAILFFLSGGHIAMFLSSHAAVVVFCGLIGATFLKFNLKDLKNTGAIVGKAFKTEHHDLKELITQLTDMANIARKDGILALEKVKVDNPFLQKAINHCVDGVDPDTMRQILENEIEYMAERHHVGILMFDSMGEAAPALGMVGTLIGMVELLANMDDPSKIGPAMAAALLATCYGAIVANMFTIPMAIKLHHYSKEEQLSCRLMVEGVLGIMQGTNPRVLEEALAAALSRREREE